MYLFAYIRNTSLRITTFNVPVHISTASYSLVAIPFEIDSDAIMNTTLSRAALPHSRDLKYCFLLSLRSLLCGNAARDNVEYDGSSSSGENFPFTYFLFNLW